MTREKAINQLKDFIILHREQHGWDVSTLDALDMAIKALEQRWIPVSERLPEEDTDVLIAYRYKDGEGDISHVNIDITSYGTVCFGGISIHMLKEWQQPFEYFHANHEVIAWMPLPEPYKAESEEKE